MGIRNGGSGLGLQYLLLIGTTITTICCLQTPVVAECRCACPTVPARGVGNTSCSAAEDSSHLCTVDFNLFGPEREGRAAALLASSGVANLSRPEPDASATRAVQAAAALGKLNDTLLLYLTVALADTPTDLMRQDVAPIAGAVRNNTELDQALSTAFGPGAAADLVNTPNSKLSSSFKVERISLPDLGQAVVSPGCLEITTNRRVWVMFKAEWAASRLQPRCEALQR